QAGRARQPARSIGLPMALAPPLPVCLAAADSAARRGATEALFAQGYDLVLAESFAQLVERAREGVSLAVVDPRLPDLGSPPLGRLRAAPALHRVPLLLIEDTVRSALRTSRAAPELVGFMVEVHTQMAGRATLE